MEGALLAWWLALCAAAAVNFALWAWSARLLARRAASMPPDLLASRRRLLWLSAVYALGCAFRSVFPMVDLPRICLHDTWVSRVVVGRTAATIAELCFALQWAILLREAGASLVARLIVPVIVLAEISCWAAVLTSNYVFHALENSLWTLAAALALAAFLSLHGRVDRAAARFLRAASACAIVYIAFMVTVDVPMYVERWLAAGGSPPLEQELRTLFARCVVVRDWDAWRRDALWLSPYFSIVVWTSVMLAHAPRLRVLR
ncbi:MAG TPA: hypothetical protein VMI74_18745 [Burkholderiales bacterium]|nr:hypothetical protein [Burkholderiales bacterium]